MDVKALSSSEHILRLDYGIKGPGEDCGDSVANEAILIAEEKAQKGMVHSTLVLQPCHTYPVIPNIPK